MSGARSLKRLTKGDKKLSKETFDKLMNMAEEGDRLGTTAPHSFSKPISADTTDYPVECTIAIFQTTNADPTYPEKDDEWQYFPAKLMYDAWYDTDTPDPDGDLVRDETVDEVRVFSLNSEYIPENHRALVFNINGQWFINYVEKPLSRFELTGSLSRTSDSTSAKWKIWNGSSYVDGDAFTIWNKQEKEWYSSAGAKGWAQYSGDNERWEIVFLQVHARFMLATLTEDMGYSTGGQASATYNAADLWGGPEENIDPVISTLTVYDYTGEAANAESGDKVVCCYDEVSLKYVIISAPDKNTVPYEPGYGMTTTHWDEETTPYTVDVNPCDADGTNVDTNTTYTVQVLTGDENQLPNLHIGQVIGFNTDADGNRVINTQVSSHFLGQLVPMVLDKSGDLPEGFIRTDGSGGSGYDTRGRILRGEGADELSSSSTVNNTDGDVGDTGGTDYNTHTDHDFDAELTELTDSGGSGGTYGFQVDDIDPYLTHSDEDNRSRFLTVFFMERVKASQKEYAESLPEPEMEAEPEDATESGGEVDTLESRIPY